MILEWVTLVILCLVLIYHLHRRVEFLFWLECELLFLIVNGEFDGSFQDINVCIGSAQKSLPKMSDTFESRCMSSTTKSTGTKNYPILTGIFLAMPNGYQTDWSANYRQIDVGSIGISNITAIKPKSLSHAMALEMLVLMNLPLATSHLPLDPYP